LISTRRAQDEYTGFGRSTNPKVTLRYAPPTSSCCARTYSTGFRVPTFKQMFDPTARHDLYAGSTSPIPHSVPMV
jgi:iron complex outermembrane receptor protein